MESYWILTIKDNGRKKYYSDEDGWVEEKSEAVWFTDYQNALTVAFDEDLQEGEFEIEEGKF